MEDEEDEEDEEEDEEDEEEGEEDHEEEEEEMEAEKNKGKAKGKGSNGQVKRKKRTGREEREEEKEKEEEEEEEARKENGKDNRGLKRKAPNSSRRVTQSKKVASGTPSESEEQVVPFQEFKDLVGKSLRVAGSWFEGEFGKKNALKWFDGAVQAAVDATQLKKKLRPAHLKVKFKGDRNIYLITDPRSISQYVVDE